MMTLWFSFYRRAWRGLAPPFETRGTAVITKNSDFLGSGFGTSGIEKKDIPIPPSIDLERDSQWRALTHDNESRWGNCRLPLKSATTVTGTVTRELVFDCRPLTYY